MLKYMIIAAAIAAAPSIALAEDAAPLGGAAVGAVGGAIVGGPVGAVVGGVGGAIVGGVVGNQQPRFREYVAQERRPSYQWDERVAVGAELPPDGVTYWQVPAEYGAGDYRYTVVNGQTVLVDPRTRRIVQVVN